MRILYHHRTQGEEPESVHISAIVTALRRLGHEVDVVGPVSVDRVRNTNNLSLVGNIKRRMPRLIVELTQIAYNIMSFAQIARALAHKKYDFVYERYAIFDVAGLMAARLFKLPIVLEVNTLYAQAWARYYGLAFPRVARQIERLSVRRADAIITVTGVLSELIQKEGVDGECVTVAHNAIDPNEFSSEANESESLRKELKLRPVVAGFVGTMNRWQGVAGFADVIERVSSARSDVGFLFVGDGEGRAGLEAELHRRGLRDAAVFLGRKPHAEIPRYLSTIDMGLLLDSNAYGSPMKIFEYWAMSKPVIAPAVRPVHEVVSDGETGFIIAPGDARAMARRIVELAADRVLRERMGRAGRACVIQSYTWEQNARKILAAVSASNQRRKNGRHSGAAQ